MNIGHDVRTNQQHSKTTIKQRIVEDASQDVYDGGEGYFFQTPADQENCQ